MDYTSLIKEVDIPELVKALRICSSELNCGDCPLLYRDSCSSDELMSDAAAAIEDLQARLGEAENSVERWKDMYLTKHEPKRGEWVWDDKRCIYVCSMCGSPKVRENMDRQIIKEQAYCYSCGAKMEAQDGN